MLVESLVDRGHADDNLHVCTVSCAGHHGITNAIYGNRTLLSAAAALSAAKQAAAPGELYQLRLSQAMLNVVWVILQRWDELQEFATANGIPWSLPQSKQKAYDVFATGLTFAFGNDEPSFDSGEHGGLHPYFTEHIPVSPGSSRCASLQVRLTLLTALNRSPAAGICPNHATWRASSCSSGCSGTLPTGGKQ